MKNELKANKVISVFMITIFIVGTMPTIAFNACCNFDEKGDLNWYLKNAETSLSSGHFSDDIDNLIANMTLEEKIGQMWLIGTADALPLSVHTRYMIEQYKIGSVIVYDWNTLEPAQLAMLTNDMQRAAENTSHKIPLFICADHEGGVWAKLQKFAVTGPGNMAIGATYSIEDAYQMGKVIGTELRAVGINVNFAPVHDVNCNPDNPIIGVRSFGGRPEIVGSLGPAMLRGMQDAGISACAKHFPGHGDTNVDSHTGLPIVPHNKSRLYNIELAPFQSAIDAGVGMIMTAHIIYPAFDDSGKPATLSKPILTDLLKREMGFDGVVITDAMTMGAITNNYNPAEACIMAIQAGVDIILDTSASPEDIGAYINGVIKAVENGSILMDRIDDAVRRVLTLKQKLRLWENRYVDPTKAEEIVGCEEHKKIEQKVATDSITLVQNDGIVPLKLNDTDNILVVHVLDPLGLVGGIGETVETVGILTSEIQKRHPFTTNTMVSLNTTDAEIEIVRTLAKPAKVVIIGTQNFVFPGTHLGCEGQAKLVNTLIEDGKDVVVMGLRDPYDIRYMPEVNAYVALYTFRKCSIIPAIEVLFGEKDAKGFLPVDIPGVRPYGYAANYGMICGSVKDVEGTPIIDADVELIGTEFSTKTIGYYLLNITEPGNFILYGLPEGDFILRISALGFNDVNELVSVHVGNVTFFEIIMMPKVKEIDRGKFIFGFEITTLCISLLIIINILKRRGRKI